MASLFANLVTHLKTVSAVTNSIGSGDAARIYKDQIPQNAKEPFIRMEFFPDASNTHLGGIGGIVTNSVQIDCYDLTEALSESLAESVRLNLQGKDHLTMGTAYINGITSEGPQSGTDPPAGGSDHYRYWTSREFLVTYQEATS